VLLVLGKGGLDYALSACFKLAITPCAFSWCQGSLQVSDDSWREHTKDKNKDKKEHQEQEQQAFKLQ